MGWGMLLKGAAKGLTKKAAVGAGKKMLGGGKKKQPQPQQKQPPSDGGGEDTGGALVKAGSSAIIPTGVKSSALAISQTPAGGGGGQDLEGTVLRIKSSVIKVENLLAGSAALQEKQSEDARKAKEAAKAKAAEGELEKPKKKQKFSIPAPKPIKSFWEKMKTFFLNTFLGFVTVRLLPFIKKMEPVIKVLAAVGSWILKIGGWVLNALVTAIDWAYKLYDSARKWVGDTFGEQALKLFDKLSNGLNVLINAFLIWKIFAGKIFQTAIGAIKFAWKLAANIVKGAVGFVKNTIKGAGNLIKGAGNFIKGTAKSIVGGVKNIGSKALSWGKNLLGTGSKAAQGGVKAVSGVAKGVAKVAGQAVKVASKVGGFAAKIFGKSAGAIGGAFKAAKPFLSKFFGKVPIVGPLIIGIVSLLSGEPAGQAIFKAMGAALGGFLGTFIPIPILGTLLGETIGVFVGDLLYTLLMGGGPKAAGKQLKDTLMGLLKAGTAVKDWVTGGFGRFIETFKEENKMTVGIGWASKSVTNWLALLDPTKTLPLLVKSFFPPGGDKDAGTKDAAPDAPSEEQPDPLVNVNLFAKEAPGKDLLMAMHANPTYDGVVEALRTWAPYEQTVVVPPVRVKEGDGEKTSAKALRITTGFLASSSGGGSDAYEKLYVGGLA